MLSGISSLDGVAGSGRWLMSSVMQQKKKKEKRKETEGAGRPQLSCHVSAGNRRPDWTP